MRSARSCSRSPRPKDATRRTGCACSTVTAPAPLRADIRTRILGCARPPVRLDLRAGTRAAGRGPLAVRHRPGRHARHGRRRAHPRRGRARTRGPRPQPTVRARSARRCSAPTTAWSRTSRSCSASARPASRARPCCSPASPACSPGRCRWAPASTSRCARSVSCSRRPRPIRPPRGARRTSTSTRTSSRSSTARAAWAESEAARARRTSSIARVHARTASAPARTGAASRSPSDDERRPVGTAIGAAISSFCFFASGALIPVLPYLFGASGSRRCVIGAGLVGIALLGDGRGRRPALGRVAPAACAAPARDRLRRGRRDLRAGPRVRHHRRLIARSPDRTLA